MNAVRYVYRRTPQTPYYALRGSAYCEPFPQAMLLRKGFETRLPESSQTQFWETGLIFVRRRSLA